MIESSTIIFLILLNHINGQQMKLIAGHVLFRHGDRTPIRTFPTDSVKETDWPNGFGQLTNIGIEQHYRLGKYLRTRYDSILSRNYISKEIYVRSTDFDRTLMSAQSNLVGLYSLSNISNDKIPIQPVPIHTESFNHDFLLGQNNCPRYNAIVEQIYQSEKVKKLNAYYGDFFEKLKLWTNLSDITIYNDQGISDTILIEYIHNKTPTWINDNIRQNLSKIISFHYEHLHSDKTISRIRGGPLIQDIWMNMNNSYNGEAFWKVKMYSGHDVTVSAVLSFLNIDYPYQPRYASALFVDLYKQQSKYFVKVEFINATDSNKPYPYLLNGCPSIECPLDIFTKLYQPYFPASADSACSNILPLPSSNNRSNKKLTVSLIVIFLVIGIIILVMFRRRIFQRTKRARLRLSDECVQIS